MRRLRIEQLESKEMLTGLGTEFTGEANWDEQRVL